MRLSFEVSFPDDRETYRVRRICRTRFAILHDSPSPAAGWADFGSSRHARDVRIWLTNPANAVIHPIVVCHDSNIPERRSLREHRTVEPFGPVFEVAAGSVVQPGDCACLDYAPSLEKPGRTHGFQETERVLLARRAVEGREIYVRRTGGHRPISGSQR